MAHTIEKDFGITISDNVKEQNPNFVALLNDIASRHDGDGVSTRLSSKLSEGTMNLKISKRECFEAEKLLEETKMLSLGARVEAKESQPYKDAHELLSVAEACQYLPLHYSNSDPDKPAFGLTKEDVMGAHIDLETLPQKIEAIHNVVAPDVEESITRECESLNEFYNLLVDINSESQFKSSQKDTSKPWQLSGVISKQIAELELNTQKLKTLKFGVAKQENDYFELLMQNLSILVDILKEHKVGHEAEYNNEKLTYLITYAQMCFHEVDKFCLQVTEKVYSPEMIKALREIREKFVKTLSLKERELNELKHTVQRYENCGEVFKEILQDYAEMLRKTKFFKGLLDSV